MSGPTIRAFVAPSWALPVGGCFSHHHRRRPWRCCASGANWDDFHYQQVRQWEGRGDPSASESASWPGEGSVHPPQSQQHKPRPTGQVHMSGHRYHASASSGPWGFNIDRSARDDAWRGGCFEWEGFKSSQDGVNQFGTHGDWAPIHDDEVEVVEDEDDHYQVLGVPRFANEADVRRGYRTMARRWHPDAWSQSVDNVTSNEIETTIAHERFIRVQLAMDVLGDPEKRRIYNDVLRFQSRTRRRPNRADFGDVETGGNPALEPGYFRLDQTEYDEFYVSDWNSDVQ